VLGTKVLFYNYMSLWLGRTWNIVFRHGERNIDLLEGVQRRATKLIPFAKDKTYEDRLCYLGLTTLETRQLRGDLIEVFKIFKGFNILHPNVFF
jgi:ribonuclease P/MRP protein subunit RPP40